MLKIITVPEPSQYVKHSVIEEIAQECNRVYRTMSKHECGHPVDVHTFADVHLQISIEWVVIEEPEGTTIFAECSPDPNSANAFIITINESYRGLFEARPDLLRSSLSHELGHCILRHHLWQAAPEGVLPLFGDLAPQQRRLHDSSWYQCGISSQELSGLCKRALVDDAARLRLMKATDRLEPDWMFRQAEQFSSCFLIPRDKLMGYLNDGWDVSQWTPIYQLSERFEVSISMMCTRLRKIGAIEVSGKQITLGSMFSQKGLLNTEEDFH